MTRERQLEISAWLLVVTQVVHGATPSRTGVHSVVGPVVGLMLLGASIAAIVGLRKGRPWARPLVGWTGVVVVVGFVLYHALPISSAVTNPYFGKSVPVAAWISVGVTIAAGAMAAALSFARPSNRVSR